MFDFSKFALNDLLKDYADKSPVIINSSVNDLHPDYNIQIKTFILVSKKTKDKDIPKDRGLAK